MKKLKIAVAGLGRIGKIHLANLRQNFSDIEVIAASDVIPESKIFADQFQVPYFTDNFDDLLNVDGLDAVAICSPTDTHADFTMKAARAGKHIFCEKPLDLSIELVKEVLDVVAQTGMKLMMGFNRRFDPNFLKVRESVAEGKIGQPQILKIISRDPGPPPISYIKVSGGIFMDQAIHDFDMARYIIGKEVVEVFAKGAVNVDPEIGKAGDIDTALSTLLFEDGTMANIDNSRKAVYGYDQRLEVFGSGGMVKVDNNFPDTHQHYGADGIHGSLPLHFFLERYTQSYINEIAAFLQAIEKNAEVPVSGNDALEAMKIALAAKRSVMENRPVTIAEI
jgi:myo-inositol 2-dehydrogenase/D-chiro-inositol 1-dehydrogenase